MKGGIKNPKNVKILYSGLWESESIIFIFMELKMILYIRLWVLTYIN